MQMTQLIALKFIERSEALGYKGKRLDGAALDYFCGAATILQDQAHPERDRVIYAIAMIVAVQGYIGVKLLAAQPDNPTTTLNEGEQGAAKKLGDLSDQEFLDASGSMRVVGAEIA